MKKIVRLVLLTFVFSLAFSSLGICAEDENLKKITDTIAGKQDKLVFASIVNIHDSIVTVDVTEEIGFESEADKEDGSDEEESETPSIEGEEIDVVGFYSYMYYDGYDHHLKKGDNVLLSLSFYGNVYSVKNGAYKVSSANYDSFMFEVPIDIQDTDDAIELTALYKFVSSNGRNADYTIKNSKLYTHNTSGELVAISEISGINYIDAHGKTIEQHTPSDTSDTSEKSADNSYKWLIATILIFVGLITGIFVSNIVIKFEKRSE